MKEDQIYWNGTNYAEVANHCPDARWKDGVLSINSKEIPINSPIPNATDSKNS